MWTWLPNWQVRGVTSLKTCSLESQFRIFCYYGETYKLSFYVKVKGTLHWSSKFVRIPRFIFIWNEMKWCIENRSVRRKTDFLKQFYPEERLSTLGSNYLPCNLPLKSMRLIWRNFVTTMLHSSLHRYRFKTAQEWQTLSEWHKTNWFRLKPRCSGYVLCPLINQHHKYGLPYKFFISSNTWHEERLDAFKTVYRQIVRIWSSKMAYGKLILYEMPVPMSLISWD